MPYLAFKSEANIKEVTETHHLSQQSQKLERMPSRKKTVIEDSPLLHKVDRQPNFSQ